MYNCGSRFIQFHACKMDTIVGDEHFFSPCRPVLPCAVCSLFIVEMCNPVLNGRKKKKENRWCLFLDVL